MDISSFTWFAVYTKSKQEQVALENLERQSFECYLPMAGSSDSGPDVFTKSGFEPLFPRYLFIKASEKQQSLAPVRSTRGVVGLVRTGLELTKIPASIISGLKTRMNPVSGLVPVTSAQLRRGDKVQVFDGAFADLEGVFQERRGLSRSLLLLDILGRKTHVEIDAKRLKPVS